MNQEPMPQGGKPGSNRKKNYPNTPAGIRLQLKGEIWLDTYAVMEQFRVSLKSVERYRKRHGLARSRIGQRRYFSETALLQFFKDHEEPGGRGKP